MKIQIQHPKDETLWVDALINEHLIGYRPAEEGEIGSGLKYRLVDEKGGNTSETKKAP